MRPTLATNKAILLGSLLVAHVYADDGDQDPPTPTITAAPIYLPYYDADSWSIVRGHILGIDQAASETTYSIFCPSQTPPACDLSLEFPFVIVEGPNSVKFHGTYTSTYIADLECDLDGTTVATCSGYSSFKSGYTNGIHTGPTEVTWTTTLSGKNVEWGRLTLVDQLQSSNSIAVTATVVSDPTATASGTRTTETSSASPVMELQWALGVMVVGAVMAGLMS